ncbi:unnamed protein product [Closterium sp. NIES-65]|nr:unnamed protein product [Closterium sp. NIES-65]
MDGRGQSSHAPRRRSSFDGILREQATTPKVTPATVAGSDGGLRRRQIGRQPQQTSQQPSQQQRRQEQQQQQQQRGADKKSGDKADKGEKGLEKSEKFDRSGRFERSESRRGGRWGCIDSCCWTMGNAVFLWFLLMLAYHLMPRQQIQAIQDALVGLPEVEPPGARLAGEGVKAKHPVVFVPGIVTGGLELWEGRPCAADLFRKRLWGGTFGDAYRRPGCWMEHMLLDNETGLDPPGIRVRPVSGLVAADYFLPGYFVWAVIIEQLAKIGYEERNMFMAAYDWRLSFYNTQKRDQTLSRLKATIEMLVKTNEGKKAVVVPHSMGVLYFLFFMKWVEAPAPLGGGGGPRWVHNHIRAVFNIGGPLLGAPKAFTGLFSAEAKDVAAIRELDPGVFERLQAWHPVTFQRLCMCLPTFPPILSARPGRVWEPAGAAACDAGVAHMGCHHEHAAQGGRTASLSCGGVFGGGGPAFLLTLLLTTPPPPSAPTFNPQYHCFGLVLIPSITILHPLSSPAFFTRALDPGVFGSLQALQHVMRVSRTWDATMSMLPKGGEAVWGNATWAPEDSFNCSKARAKQLHLQQQQQAGESGGNSSKAGGDGRAKGSGKGLGVEGFLRTLMAEGASSSAPSSSSPSSASSAAATASTTGAHSEGSGDGGQSGSEGDGAKAVARAAAATCPATFHSYFPLLYVSFGEASATLSESLVCPSGAKAAARAAAATCPAASTCPATWGGQQYVLSDPCSCAMRDLLPEGDDEYSDETAYKGAEGKGGASSGGERDESEGKEEKAPVRESRRKQWQRQLEETVFQHLQSRNKSCGEVWTEYHDMSWHALKDIANCPFYTAGDESDGPSGGILGLLRQVAPKTMARADENWSYGIAEDLSERKYAEEPKYWANPLETSLPDAPEMEVYCAYGTGLLTERAYVYRLSPSNDTCLIPFRIDASANGPPGQAGDCLTEGAYFTDGDETAPVLSMGLPCAKLWRGRTRFNPAASPTYLREYEHRPTSGLLAGRSTQSGSHVDIMGNFALIEDILRVAAGATGAEIGGDQIYSDILHWAERVSIKL